MVTHDATTRVAAGEDPVWQRMGLGVLAAQIPAALVDEVLAGTGCVQQRIRRLPSRVVVWFVLALPLFQGQGYRSVWWELTHTQGQDTPARLDGRVVLPPRDSRSRERRRGQLSPPAPATQAFGAGTLSSSDGQRFPVKGKSITARHLSRYFARGQGVSTYTHVSDQHSTFDTKVIVATAPESHYVLDGLLGNETDLPVFEHATDTQGATLANFALFDLVGKQVSPRIRDLGKITLYRTGLRADFLDRYPRAGALLTRRLNLDLITDMWDDLLRVAASVQGGHATAALVVGKLCSSKRQQNALTSAIKEYGALRRTVYATRYLADETYRRRIARQLNKGENLHALRRSLAYAREGALRRRHHEQQTEQMWCLTLATNAIVCWSTEYHGLGVAALRRTGRDVDDEVLAHIWPTHHENVRFYGTHSVDIDGELAQLDTDGYRPLRLAEAAPRKQLTDRLHERRLSAPPLMEFS